MMDDVFGYDNLTNEIIWCYRGGGVSKRGFANKHDTIYSYEKTYRKSFYAPQFSEYSAASKKMVEENNGFAIDGKQRDISRGCHMNDWWTDINSLQTWSPERLKYGTQKPKELLSRIILASSSPDDIIADFYMGSGTTGEVALENGRRFIGCDVGDKACDISMNRLLKFDE